MLRRENMEPLGRAQCSCRTHHSPRAVRRPSGSPAPALTLSYLPGSFPPELASSCGASLSAGTRLVLLQEQAFIRTPRKGSPVPCPQPANQITATWPCSQTPQPACHARSQQPCPPTAGVGLLGDNDRLTTTSRVYNARAAEYLWQERPHT